MALPIISSVGTATPPAATYNSKPVISDLYTVRLTIRDDDTINGGKPYTIIANLPERWHTSMSAQWSTPFARSDLSQLAGRAASAVEAASALSGISTRLKPSTVQVWESSSEMTFSMDLAFVAYADAGKEIREVHRNLLKLVAPSEIAGMVLRSPGPTPLNALSNSIGLSGRRISLELGRYLMLEDVIIKSVSCDMPSMFEKNGIPISMTASLEISSYFSCFTTNDIDKMLGEVR